MFSSGERFYGCLFCLSGREERVAEQMMRACAALRATPARREEYRSHRGQKTKTVDIMLPGYVFFEAPADAEIAAAIPQSDVLRLLSYAGSDWRLRCDDADFARWLFENGGVFAMSKAYRDGERIRIASGPLRDRIGRICRVDRRGRSCQIELNLFENRVTRIWLGFELLDGVIPADEGKTSGSTYAKA